MWYRCLSERLPPPRRKRSRTQMHVTWRPAAQDFARGSRSETEFAAAFFVASWTGKNRGRRAASSADAAGNQLEAKTP
eukprot:CAMPEP_0172679148 /NCGR_PEP_ID=MMETSP1074-20121228/15871_1 /TAXON_ID=2916 /ORGANISM="Ceratium fusus, Strain PA161109" /LENGTH=77 /DNA_ID=CAMNT_0013497275 /DNA_START=362 /DNA_END=595 /DNA_ORIENTATION=+